MRNLIILGSTGSIGTQALEIIRENPGRLKAVALAANRNVEAIEAQIREFKPRFAAMYDEEAAAGLKVRVKDLDVKVYSGMEGLISLCELDEADTVLNSVVGMIGVRPTVAAIEAGKDIALANKETLVTAGHIIMPLAAKKGVKILPVDSEHSAIWQCLQGEEGNAIERILLTASGGPFRGKTKKDLENVGVEDALKHPNWSMGAKITIDSATMVNKGLEVIEACRLYDIPASKITVVVHPESIVHSMVEYADGAVMAQLGIPDMKLPIKYALFHPERVVTTDRKLDLFEIASLNFERPDTETFRGLKLAYDALEIGGSMTTVYNAANEVAVARFLKGETGFLSIAEEIERAMDAHEVIKEPSLEEVLETEADVRKRRD